MKKAFLMCCMILCLVGLSACGDGAKEDPALPMPDDSVVCKNDIFSDLQPGTIREIGCRPKGLNMDCYYRSDRIEAFVKYLKEDSFRATNRGMQEVIWEWGSFVIVELDGTEHHLFFHGDICHYDGKNYTDFSPELKENLEALFEDLIPTPLPETPRPTPSPGPSLDWMAPAQWT